MKGRSYLLSHLGELIPILGCLLGMLGNHYQQLILVSLFTIIITSSDEGLPATSADTEIRVHLFW